MTDFKLSGCLVWLTTALSLCWAQPAGAQVIEVAQESAPGVGDFDANVLGSIAAVASPLDVVSYYSYSVPLQSSFNGPAPVLVDGNSYLFVHHLVPAGELSLVVVHDRTNDGSGGAAAMQIEIFRDPNGAEFRAYDDPGENYTGPPGSTVFTASNNWASCCTDGFALGALEGPWETWVEFTASPTGVTTWRAFSGTGAEISLVLQPGRRVRLQEVPCSPALWLNYGRGWPGTNGIPSFVCTANPVLGSTITLQVDNSAGAPTGAVLLAGFGATVAPTGFGGNILVASPLWLPFSLPAAGFGFLLVIPSDPVFCGAAVFLQTLELDVGASHFISFSPGLEMHLGF